ncbi:beta-ketoacyl-[acyl-carrier-protein] synthase family protein [Flavitalea sp.]|nr:beta-ketoacyl synthase N-terminal-like domain-containing protein [Flavitalea sp.]
MRAVYTIADNILSPLGFNTEENFLNLKQELTGIKKHDDPAVSPQPFQASLFSDKQRAALMKGADTDHSMFERALINSVKDALSYTSVDPADPKTVFIISSTKGNIAMVEKPESERVSAETISLYHSAKIVATHFDNRNLPLVVSNACISGVLAILTAKRLIESGAYEHAIVAGADIITKFILSGFQSFQAVSPEPCKPFDQARDGVTLGEGAATMILSVDSSKGNKSVLVMAGSTSNDANHISGPSRTGEPLFNSISKSIKQAGIKNTDIGFISAHGTATIYNDEMEARAISLAGMQQVPVNSLKGYYGHTLGAAGLIESIVSVESLREDIVLPTKGFRNLGVSQEINVCAELENRNLKYMLKTASGFGGCNAAMIFGKNT